MHPTSRRDFLRHSLLGAAAFSTGIPALTAEKGQPAAKPDETLRIAVIGVRGQGMSHVNGYAGRKGCRVTHVCDADAAVIGPAMTAVEKAQGQAPHFVQDFRKVLDDKAVDAVSIATPNHWHALMAIWAIQAGKDVYVEKPVSHNVSEGRKIVEAARKYGRICQTGTQCRSMEGTRQAMAFLHSGGIGKVRLARGLCYKLRPSIGKTTGPQDVPATVDYDLWCGPSPKKPLRRRRLHYDWHWVWDHGNGDLGNQGIHQMDLARWGLGHAGLPRSVVSVGGRFGYDDDGETANSQIILLEYDDAPLIFEVRGLPSQPLHGASVGVAFYGSEGTLVIPTYDSAVVLDAAGKKVRSFKAGGDHFGNFLQAVRTRKAADLHADIQEGHLSSALCHLGNISYRLGEMLPFSKESRAFGDNKDAHESLARMQDHLKSNGVPFDRTSYRVGRRLKVDPAREAFVGDKEADALLSREPRPPFVVPDQV